MTAMTQRKKDGDISKLAMAFSPSSTAPSDHASMTLFLGGDIILPIFEPAPMPRASANKSRLEGAF